MDESLINQLINIATDLSKVYNQIVIAESRSDNSKLKKLKNELRLKPFDFQFEHDGSSVIYIGDKYWEDNR